MTSEHPDPAVIERAIASLSNWTGESVAGQWDVHDRMEFRHSTIFFIDVAGSASPNRLVYKVRASTDADWFQSNLPLVNVAVRQLEAEGLRGSPILATDVDQLTVVTLFIPGQKFEPLRWSERRLTDRHRRIYWDIGRACHILEAVAPPFSDNLVKDEIWRGFQVRLRDAWVSRRFAEGVERFASGSLALTASRPNPFVMAHKDMTYSNIVIDGDVAGFIDLGFTPALKGSSVAKILHRIEYMSRLRTPAVKEATDAVMEGYGALDFADGMKFLRADLLLRSLKAPRSRSWASPGRRRALNELKSLIESAAA